MSKILKKSPLWVIGYDDGDDGHRSQTGFVRATSTGMFIKNQCFLECSKWEYEDDARKALSKVARGNFFLYRVTESEDGCGRLLLQLTKEN